MLGQPGSDTSSHSSRTHEAGRAAGSGGSCWRSQECSAPSLSRAFCCQLCLTFEDEKKPGMERRGPTTTAFRSAGWPGGSDTGGAPAAAGWSRQCSGTPLLLDRITLHSRACACLYICGITMCSDWLARRVRGKEVLELLLQFPVLEATQIARVVSRWAVTTWPASLGWPSGPAGETLEGRLACFARRGRVPSRCHADRILSLRLSAGLMAHQTPLPGLVSSAAPLALSSPKHTFTHSIFTHSIFHSMDSRR